MEWPQAVILRPYQDRAVAALRACPRGIVWAPAGSGKTVIGAAALDLETLASSRRLRIAWIANTKEQIDQAEVALARHDLRSRADVLVVCAAAEPDLAGFDIIVVDECHHAAADGWVTCLSRATGRVWGLTATPYRPDERAPKVFQIIGPIVCEITRHEVGLAMANGIVEWRTPHVKFELARAVDVAAAPEMRPYRWSETMCNRILFRHARELGIFQNDRRNTLIVNCATTSLKSGHSTLVLVATIEHGELLQKRIPSSEIVFSGLSASKRRDLIGGFRNGSLPCLIATSLADEGFDVPRASVLVLACGGRSASKTEQRTGRVLRKFEGKTAGKIIDFHDIGHGMLLAQSRARSRLYQQLGYREIWISEMEPALVGIKGAA